MYPPSKAERGPGTALLLITIIVVGVFLLSFFSVQTANDQNRRVLEERASTIAAALDANTITKLAGTEADAALPQYRELKSKLTALKQLNSDVRSVYLTGNRDGEVFFYVDSERPDSSYYSPPGEAYPEATAIFKNLFFSSPIPVVEGPTPDKFGTWVSGLAPIFDPQTGRVLAVIGLDVDAVTFNQNLLGALALPLAGGLMLALVVVVYEWTRRHDRQFLQLRSELVSIASHELRSPLVGVRWAIERFLKDHPKAEGVDTMKAVYDSVLHLQSGTDDILEFTTISGSKKLELKPADLRAIIQEIFDAQRLVAAQKSVNLVFDDSWPTELPVMCDAVRLKRALHNVISNGIKYTRTNTPVVLHYQRTSKEHLISVIDHGIGIPERERKRVLSGFYRASNAKASGVVGTGLGLYLSRVVMQQHHGHLSFQSEEGKGTTFTLGLPVKMRSIDLI